LLALVQRSKEKAEKLEKRRKELEEPIRRQIIELKKRWEESQKAAQHAENPEERTKLLEEADRLQAEIEEKWIELEKVEEQLDEFRPVDPSTGTARVGSSMSESRSDHDAEKRAAEDLINSQFFEPFEPPDVSLVVDSNDKRLRRNWPPPGWRTSKCPLDDSLDAIRQWFDFVAGISGVLVCRQVLDRDSRVLPDYGSPYVRDAWSLFEHLKAKGQINRNLEKPSQRYNADEARFELASLRDRMFNLTPLTTAGVKPGEDASAPATAMHPDGPAQPTTAADFEQHMERVAQAIGDDNAVRILAIAQRKDWSGERKMEEILRLDSRFVGKDSTEWGKLLGVSPAAVRGYGLWKQLQKAKRSED
jgi:hypothetical protein